MHVEGCRRRARNLGKSRQDSGIRGLRATTRVKHCKNSVWSVATFWFRISLAAKSFLPHAVFVCGQEPWKSLFLDDDGLLTRIRFILHHHLFRVFANLLDAEMLHVEQSSLVEHYVGLTITREREQDGAMF